MHVNSILVPVSVGELVDKISILEIKQDRIADEAKRANVRIELQGLMAHWHGLAAATPALPELKERLRAINERMWLVQDDLREKERTQTFDEGFVQLARSVATLNGERVQLKNEINRVSGSAFVEEKQYR